MTTGTHNTSNFGFSALKYIREQPWAKIVSNALEYPAVGYNEVEVAQGRYRRIPAVPQVRKAKKDEGTSLSP